MFNSEKMTLYIDIGTNGEMALGNKDWLLSCSCSAGPAFEGAGVKHGMRATRGAIEQVRINEVTQGADDNHGRQQAGPSAYAAPASSTRWRSCS